MLVNGFVRHGRIGSQIAVIVQDVDESGARVVSEGRAVEVLERERFVVITNGGSSWNHVVAPDGDAAGFVAVLAKKILKSFESSIARLSTLNGVDLNVEGIVRGTIEEK